MGSYYGGHMKHRLCEKLLTLFSYLYFLSNEYDFLFSSPKGDIFQASLFPCSECGAFKKDKKTT